MEIGNDDLDFFEEDLEIVEQNIQPEDLPISEEGDFLTDLLRERGIEDKTKIKFENEHGFQEELDWDSLSKEDKLNIINSSTSDPDVDLDDSEIQLINAIRSSNMTPDEYIQYIQKGSVDRYLLSSQQALPNYSIDQYSDDELFVMDFIARMGDITDEEAREALDNAKSNETLFAKLIGAIRNEYKKQEDEINRQNQLEYELQAQELYNQFANSVADLINNFTEYSGYELNLENEDMQLLYEFITGMDAAGNNYFAKALADPKTLVRTAYLALNGELMINDITSYFLNEITNVRKESYKKGVEDTQKKMSNVVFKSNANSKSTNYADLDDF